MCLEHRIQPISHSIRFETFNYRSFCTCLIHKNLSLWLLYPLMLDGIGDCKDANRLDKLVMEHLDKFFGDHQKIS
jgi:hypothetical protein